ncbi:site-specific integrase (plasmid) [Halolamina sp. CBA1230]|uniref:tyrosine-type recombinase/integrase n=1 Tax=Halolamina sp. CBA1230 TaxID=1853690 RepID=UPI0009A1FAF8|nr:site-specific integrase [Halolamina sp. CBA1230]QKY22272.1 site-specific integrase [Halolamina sp. CBA1230]
MSGDLDSADYPAVADELVDAAEQFLESKGKGSSGNYRRNCARALRAFFQYLDTEDPSPPAEAEHLDDSHFRRFARYLAVEDWLTPGGEPKTSDETSFTDSISSGTMRTYYAMVSAWCGWSVREGVLSTHYADSEASQEPLPENSDDSVRDQQTWSQEQRETITRYTDHIVGEALDDVDRAADAAKELRDRAFVDTIAFSGVRGGEILRDPNDPDRDGLRWGDVNLDRELIWVVPKKRKKNIDDRALTPKPVPALKRLQAALNPAEEWPVFPSLAWRLYYKRLRNEAPDHLSEDDVEGTLDAVDGRADLFDLCREWGVTPPAVNTTSGRNVLQRLCEDLNNDEDFVGELDFSDSKHDYLAPHGARRGVGKVLVKQRGYDDAAEQLDNTPGVVQKHYSHIKVPERSADVGAAFDEESEE